MEVLEVITYVAEEAYAFVCEKYNEKVYKDVGTFPERFWRIGIFLSVLNLYLARKWKRKSLIFSK